MTTLLPELRSVHLRETDAELVLEVDVPPEVDLARLSASVTAGTLTIRVPRIHHIPGFHADAAGV